MLKDSRTQEVLTLQELDYDNVDELAPLRLSNRSPFYGLKNKALFDILELSNSRVVETHAPDFLEHSRPKHPTDDTEGVVLFEQYEPATYFYIPLPGAKLAFFDRRMSGKENSHSHDPISIRFGLPLGIVQLVNGFRYSHSICAGEIGSLIPLVTAAMKRQNEEYRRDGKKSVRWLAYAQTNLLGLAGKWHLSGIASNHSRVLQIETRSFLDFLYDTQRWGNVVGWVRRVVDSDGRLQQVDTTADDKARQPRLTREDFLTRCMEEALIRHSERLYRQSLAACGAHDRALAGLLYELSNADSKPRRSVTASNPWIAWYLNLQEHDISRSCEINLSPHNPKGYWRKTKTGNTFGLEQRKLLSYYMGEFNHAR
jgi:hypothetical protein